MSASSCWMVVLITLPLPGLSPVPFIFSQILIYFMGDKFQVKLPGGHELEFPNRHSYDKISYLSVKGGFRVTSFKQD